MFKANILQIKIDIIKLNSMIENYPKKITYLIMSKETLDKFLIQTDLIYPLKDFKHQIMPKYSLKGFYSYMDYPIAICDILDLGEVEIV